MSCDAAAAAVCVLLKHATQHVVMFHRLDMTQELLDYLDAGLKMAETG